MAESCWHIAAIKRSDHVVYSQYYKEALRRCGRAVDYFGNGPNTNSTLRDRAIKLMQTLKDSKNVPTEGK